VQSRRGAALSFNSLLGSSRSSRLRAAPRTGDSKNEAGESQGGGAHRQPEESTSVAMEPLDVDWACDGERAVHDCAGETVQRQRRECSGTREAQLRLRRVGHVSIDRFLRGNTRSRNQ